MHRRQEIAILLRVKYQNTANLIYSEAEARIHMCVCVMICSITFVWNTWHSYKNSARYYQKCTNVFM